MNPPKIQAIDKTSVHRICSGQVVLSLAVAVKELIENSLDAGATLINVRLKEYGSELLEVSDNGSGVHPDNFQALTLKHHTSKLRDFSELENVSTFGFRGEALSSLCALSTVTVSTRHSSQHVGTCLTFQHTGDINSSNHIPRQVGTTVALANLFSTLPVRQKEFQRNLKKEFNKMTQLLNAYCLVSTNVRITCTNQTSKGSKTTFVSTLGCPTVKENISSVFGPKQLTNLLELKTVKPDAATLEELKLDASVANMFTLEGFISSCAHGSGRPAADRQFYYINSRPCEPNKVMKAVNEVYHQFNVHQVPFVYMNVLVDRTSVDVNVTPDKRQVFLDQEKLLIATVKASLYELYSKIPSTYTVNSLKRPLSQVRSSGEVESQPSLDKFSQFRHKSDATKTTIPSSSPPSNQKSKQMKLDNHFSVSIENKEKNKNILSSFKNDKAPNKVSETKSSEIISVLNATGSRVGQLDSGVFEDTSDRNVEVPLSREENLRSIGPSRHESVISCDMNNSNLKTINNFESDSFDELSGSDLVISQCEEDGLSSVGVNISNSQIELNDSNSKAESNSQRLISQENLKASNLSQNDSDEVHRPNTSTIIDDHEGTDELKDELVTTDCNDGIPDRRTVIVNFSLEALKRSTSKLKDGARLDNPCVKFRSAINPSQNVQAEEELSREISKDRFRKMDIVGQFNLGFIITKLGSDLFIVDQHATDEKYNFETLQQTTTLSSQKLVVPQNLELTVANECLLLENLEVFEKNGFEFKIDKNEAASKRIKLSSIPMSKNWIFGKEDVDELLFMLQDVNPGTMCRPSRVRSMFASRACRMSVMIGSHLSAKDMRKLIDHMGQIEQPWNCPHGRPTMRHLINLDLTE